MTNVPPFTKDPSDYNTDTLWNLMAFATQAASGAILTIGLYFYSGATYLGIFNQLYAIFVIAGQLFVFGLHDSVSKHSAEYFYDTIESARLTLAVLFVGIVAALIGSAVVLIGANTFAKYFYSEPVQFGLLWMAPGIFFFVINKVLLGLFNGRQKFKRFAIVQSLRAVTLVSLVFFVVLTELYIGYLGLCFTLTELVIFVSQINITFSIWRKSHESLNSFWDVRFWMKRHITFGTLSMPHGFLSESFIRIDILVLAFFVGDAAIGIYSFASFFVEGVYQIPVLIRNVTNPRLVRILGNRDRTELWKQVKKSSGLSFLFTIILCVIIASGLSYIGQYLDIENLDTLLAIMMIIFPGLIVYSLFIPFDYAVLQGGKPALQSLYMFMVSLLNVMANLILIPTYGLIGAAIGTTISMAVSGGILIAFIYFVFNIPDWPKHNLQNK